MVTSKPYYEPATRTLLIKMPIPHNTTSTTTIEGNYAEYPEGYHITVSFEDAQQLDSGTHSTIYAYMTKTN
jgi:hypothetical protein